jgi:hypothetical protein
MTWNRDMSRAPRGNTKQVRLSDKHNGTREVTVKVPVIISSGDSVILSSWSEKRGQWVGLADGEDADGWLPWPDPCGAEV